MAKEWAKKFYESKAWQYVRDNVLKEEYYTCRQCNGSNGPAEIVHHIIWLTRSNINNINITLDKSNLMPVCRVCHAKIHEGKSSTVEGIVFNSEGELVSYEII